LNWIYYVLLIITSILWAGNFVAGKFMVGHAGPLVFTVLRWGIAVIFLVPLVWIKERRLLPPRQALIPLILMGVTGVVLFNGFMFMALERTSADNAGLISAMNPLAIAVASYLILKEKMTGRQVASMTLSLMGVLVVISQGQWQRLLELRLNTGDLFMLGAISMWGLYSVAGRKAMNYTSPFLSTLWSGFFGVLILLPFSLSSFTITSPDYPFWLAVLFTSVGATVAAMVFWNMGIQKLGGTKSGMFLNLNPIFTALLAYLFIGEQMNMAQLVGTALIIVGVYFFTTTKRV
jgi:drug/metabolite transporter (DMT)-like permease